ncbi:MAG: FAD-dependent oxidoreductase [Chloroflexota bacterium]|nr:FAD-dependent oxidoreductase [Chloroflexota bacterium]
MEQREVVVVGGGPAGASTAALLARNGHDVLLLDKARFPRQKACSEYASPALIDALDRLGVRPAYEAEGPVRLRGMNVLSPEGREVRIEYPQTGGSARHALTMSRERLDPLLLRHARGCGVEVREGGRVRSLLCDGDAVRGVEVSGPDGAGMPIRSRLVVGADGLHSVVAREVGARSEMLWPRRLGLVGHYESVEGTAEGYGEMHVQQWGYCGVAALPNGLTSIGMALDMRRYRGRVRGPEAMFEEALGMFPSIRARLRDARRISPVSGIGPIARRVRRTEGDGWALAGDAAGFTDPFTGEGIYRAVRSGELLAGVASSALRNGGASARGLAPYGQARREAFRHKALVVLLVQAFVSYPVMLEFAAERGLRRPEVRSLLSAVLGDYQDARRVLRPGFLLDVLRP